MHFSVVQNPALDRVDAICGAIRSIVEPSDNCILALTGDIADLGKAQEYEIAYSFIKSIYKGLGDYIKASLHIIIVPGNHDHDFDLPDFQESIRDLIIEKSSPQNPPDQAMHDYCLKSQQPFRNFADRIGSEMSASIVRGLLESELRSFPPAPIQLHLLNTTRFTRRRDAPGRIWFPVEQLALNLKKHNHPDSITIGILHHPYNWHHPDNGRQLKSLLESHCDILLTGHEHNPDQYLKLRRTTEQNLYVEGGILQDHDNPDNSSFNIVRIVPDEQIFKCWSFAWTGTRYDPLSEHFEHRYLRLRKPLLNQFELEKEWSSYLEQLNTDLRNPRCRDLKLSDLFVYPDLQRLDVRKACSPTGIVRDRDVVGFIQERKRTLIAGAEKTGKTCLAKRLFIDLQEAGYIPILIDADFKVQQRKKMKFGDALSQSIDDVCRFIYGEQSATQLWQAKPSDRAIIIDDYDALPLGTNGRDEMLRWFDEHFGCVVLLADPGIRITEILNRSGQDTLLWTYEHVDILECDAESRYSLIRNWLLAGTDSFSVSLDKVYENAVRYAQVIDAIIGQGAIPSLPIYILMMMQQIETRGNVENTTGLYGSLYELIIRDVIKGAAADYADLEVKLNYLSEFAFALYSRGKRFLEEAEFATWHARYCQEYNCQLDPLQMALQFEAIGVFRKYEANIGFKYRYYYCFFLARYFANNIHDNDIVEEIRKACLALYDQDAANTMLFLCHLSKDPRILQMILRAVDGHFKDTTEYNLSLSPQILPDGVIRPFPLMLSAADPEEERVRTFREYDDMSRPHGLDEVGYGEIEKAKEDKIFNLIKEANSAHHAIRICGQLIRNFYGSMKGSLQVEIIRKCYGVCLRMMGILYDLLEEDKEEIAVVIAKILHHRYPKMDEQEIDRRARRSLQIMALSIGYGLVKHVSNSVGLSALKPSFDTLIKEADTTVSHRILDISARLDYFDAFPENAALDLATDLEKGSVGHEVLRVLVWEHFKLFRRDYKVRQRVCKKLGIDAPQTSLLLSEDKK